MMNLMLHFHVSELVTVALLVIAKVSLPTLSSFKLSLSDHRICVSDHDRREVLRELALNQRFFALVMPWARTQAARLPAPVSLISKPKSYYVRLCQMT
jgi:hypothetical protein